MTTTTTILIFQGRAPTLYDEQLQRLQQEKALFADFGPGKGGGLLSRSRGAQPASTSKEHSDGR
jgi:hypothetical protein